MKTTVAVDCRARRGRGARAERRGLLQSDGGKQERQRSSGGGGGNVADTPRYRIAMITHGAPGDTFWDIDPQGRRAGRGEGQRRAASTPNDPRRRQAGEADRRTPIDSKVDGIAVTLPNPDALKASDQEGRRRRHPGRRRSTPASTDWQDSGASRTSARTRPSPARPSASGSTRTGVKQRAVRHPGAGPGRPGAALRRASRRPSTATSTNLTSTAPTCRRSQSTIAGQAQAGQSIDCVLTLGGAVRAGRGRRRSRTPAARPRSPRSTSTPTGLGMIEAGDAAVRRSTSSPTSRATSASTRMWLYKNNGNDIGGGRPVYRARRSSPRTTSTTVAKFAEAAPGDARSGSRRTGGPRPRHPAASEDTMTQAPEPAPHRRPAVRRTRRRALPAGTRLLRPARGRRARRRDRHLSSSSSSVATALPRAGGAGDRALLSLHVGIMAVAVALLMIGGEFDLSAGVAVTTSALTASMSPTSSA